MTSSITFENTKDNKELNFEETIYRSVPFQAEPPVIHRQLGFQIPWHDDSSYSNAAPNYPKS